MFGKSVRASRLERTRAMPGDDLIPEPIGSLTNATTIGRPRQDVWPWIVQMGAGRRAGWYSYDFIDNGHQRSAARILPDLQTIAVGTLFPAVRGATDGFHVLMFETGKHLVLGWRPSPSVPPMMTWAFVLEERADGTTRMIVRARGGRGYAFYGLPPRIGMPVVRFGHFIMQRKQLLGITSRVESQKHSGGRDVRTELA